MRGKVIWYSAPEKIGYVMREGTRMAYTAPIIYFFNHEAFPDCSNYLTDVVGQPVEFDTMFNSQIDSDVVKTARFV